MSKLRNLLLSIEQILKSKESLEKEYTGKLKGRNYISRSVSLTKKLTNLENAFTKTYRGKIKTYKLVFDNGRIGYIKLSAEFDRTDIEMICTYEYGYRPAKILEISTETYYLGQLYTKS